MAVSKFRARKHKVLHSVFDAEISQPTPLLPSTEPGEPFGGPPPPPAALAADAAAPRLHEGLMSDQVQWDRAWHVVTSRIQLPSSVAIEDSFGTLAPESQEHDDVFSSALALLVDPRSTVPLAPHTEDILSWHTHQVRQHFVNHVLPLLSACSSQGSHDQALLASIRTLEAAHRQYLYGLSLIVRGYGSESSAHHAMLRFRRDLHAIIGSSWTSGLQNALRQVLSRLIVSIVCVDGADPGSSPDLDQDERTARPRNELLELVSSLQNVGLAGEKFQALLAEIMDSCMQSHIYKTYSGVWSEPRGEGLTAVPAAAMLTGCVADLREWIENKYGQLAVLVFNRLGLQVEYGDVECWKEIGIGRLVSLRTQELFDIVLRWPHSKGGVDDLRAAVTTPARRLQLTDVFSATLQKRLLNPGRSTLSILKTYISMIRTFHALDPSKVLLDRVVQALQLYLCQRDDAIRIVVTGLLSNPKDLSEEESEKRLVELATILNDPAQQQRRQIEGDDADWNDMSWIPDPVDAGVNYKRPKNEDVIGTLISALGSQEIFIKEFQAIIAERLLSSQTSYQQELKVLGLLKRRFGEPALQNCDVMMKDIQDSRRLDAILAQRLEPTLDADGHSLGFHSKILSRLFWPSMPKESFSVPKPVAALREQYAAGFERVKNARKLNWLDHLGLATVHLELEDRTIDMECKTYEAAVIFAFDQGSEPAPVQKTFDEIWLQLTIDEDLLDAALTFWQEQKVLKDIGDRTYIVMERLDDESPGDDPDTTVDGSRQAPSARKAKGISAQEQQRQAVYWQFVVGMLTNGGPKPLAGILTMMKMLIPGGCTWSSEDLQQFMNEKVSEGNVELVGGKYRIPKK